MSRKKFLNVSWGTLSVSSLHVTVQFSLWLWNKEQKQQKNLDLSSDEDSTFGLLEKIWSY